MIEELHENSLLAFKNGYHFLHFYEGLDIYKEWKITTGSMNYRGELIRSKPYALMLENLFAEKAMFRRKVSIAEIVSWLDSFKIIERLVKEMIKNFSSEVFMEIEIFSEYKIRMSKKMRIDYIFKYRDTLLLLELRMVSKFEKLRPTWEKKKLELIIYKDLINNYFPDTYRVINYALITLPEYQIKREISKHIDYNINQINHLLRYIKQFIIGQ